MSPVIRTRNVGRSIALGLALATAVLAAVPAATLPAALKPPISPAVVQPGPGSQSHAQESAGALCTVGVSGPRAWLLDYLQPPSDAYYLRVAPSSCAACAGAPGAWVTKIHITLEFRTACTLPVDVAVVASAAGSGCRAPDDVRLLSGPWPASLVADAPGTFDFTLALDHAAPVLDTAYLKLTFKADGSGCADNATRPRLVTSSSCTNCTIWNYYPADSADLCELLVPGTPLIWAEIDSCVSPSLAAVDPEAPRPSALRVTPNPVHHTATIAFALAAQGRARVDVMDVAGRRVRTLLDARLEAGPHALVWDGRDDDGARAKPGAYFAVVRGTGRALSRAILLLR